MEVTETENQTNNRHIRILHTSDLHLGSYENGHNVLEALVKLAAGTNVDLVVIAGDLFDSNHVGHSIVNFTVEQLHRFKVPVVILPGNHDCLVQDSVYNRTEFFQLNSHISIFRNVNGEEFLFPELALAVWGKPLTDYGGDLRPLADIPLCGSPLWHIAIAHGCFMTSKRDAHHSFQITKEEIVSSGRDYVALGHWPALMCVCETPVKAYYSGSATQNGTVLIIDFTMANGSRVTPFQLRI